MNADTAPHDQLSDYLSRIGDVALLTASEEVELARRMEAGTYAAHLIEQGAAEPELETVAAEGRAARKRMIEANLRLVVSIAKRYAHRGLSLADVIQDGNLGLIEAVERFDHTRGNRFSTVATWWIRKAIQRGLEHAHTIRLPIGVQDQLARIARAEADATHRLGRRPTDQELAEETGQEPAKVAALRRLPRQALIMRLRFGLDGHGERTPRQIADKFGLTPHWVRQLEKELLALMRGRGNSGGLRAWAS